MQSDIIQTVLMTLMSVLFLIVVVVVVVIVVAAAAHNSEIPCVLCSELNLMTETRDGNCKSGSGRFLSVI
jgi:hypothetical protein